MYRQPAEPDWWRTAVVYQIYPRSFADANGDGIGDLHGVRSRLPYLAELGVDAIWLSPFYPSPLADGGYDISDHRDVDPRLGTLDDFDASDPGRPRAGHQGSSSTSCPTTPPSSTPGSSRRSRRRSRVTRAGPLHLPRRRGRGRREAAVRLALALRRQRLGTPSATDSGTATSSHASSPTSTGTNPEVRQYFLDTLRFWADRGVDGFRVDVAHSLAKDLGHPLRSQPHLDAPAPARRHRSALRPGRGPRDLPHLACRLRRVRPTADGRRRDLAPDQQPHLPVRPSRPSSARSSTSPCSSAPGTATQFRTVIQRSLQEHQALGTGGTDLGAVEPRRPPARLAAMPCRQASTSTGGCSATAPTRPSTLRSAVRRARAATLMMLALPGSAYLYQGEELGLLEVADLEAADLRDPVWERTGHALKGRDGARVPIPWTASGPSHGFGDGAAWLPQPAWFAHYAVEEQDHDPTSTLALYRQALALRRTRNAPDPVVAWADGDPDVLHFTRANGWTCVTNFSTSPKPLPRGEVLLSSEPVTGTDLPPETTIWLAAP